MYLQVTGESPLSSYCHYNKPPQAYPTKNGTSYLTVLKGQCLKPGLQDWAMRYLQACFLLEAEGGSHLCSLAGTHFLQLGGQCVISSSSLVTLHTNPEPRASVFKKHRVITQENLPSLTTSAMFLCYLKYHIYIAIRMWEHSWGHYPHDHRKFSLGTLENCECCFWLCV